MRRDRLLIVGLAAFFSGILIVAYSDVVANQFAYFGFRNEHPGAGFVVLGFVLAVLPSLWIRPRVDRPSYLIFWLLYVFAYIPAQALPFFVVREPGVVVPWSLSLFVGLMLMDRILVRRPRHTFQLASGGWPAWALVVPLLAVAYSFAARSGQLSIQAPSIGAAYVHRASYRLFLSRQGLALGYLIPWTGNVLNPFLMSYGWVKRKLWWFALGALGQIALYSLTGFKSVLLSPGFIVLIYVSLRRNGQNFGRDLLVACGGVTALALAAYWIVGNTFVIDIIVARVFAVPGVLAGFHVEFFSSHPYTLFSDTFMKYFISPRYPLPTPFIIGDAYFGSTALSANASLFVDGFAGLGPLGVVFISVAAGVVLHMIDSAVASKDWRLMAGVFGIAGFTLANTALTTSLLTHGLLLATVIGLLLPYGPGKSVARRRHQDHGEGQRHRLVGAAGSGSRQGGSL